MRGVVAVVLFAHIKLCWKVSLAQKDNDDEYGNAEEAISEDRIGGEEEVLLFVLFVFFGFVVSAFGSLLGYVSFVEDRLMQEYVKKGFRTEGDVVAMEFTRGVGRNEDALMKFENEKEYFVTVEYSFHLSAHYPVRVRKQLRVLEGEFLHPDQPELNPSHPKNSKSNTTFQYPCSTGKLEVDDRAVGASLNTKPIIEIVTSSESFLKKFQLGLHGQKVLLLVYPTHPLSALPVRQVERRISPRYRLYSSIFVITAITIAVFCYQLATQFLLAMDTKELSSNGMVESSFAQKRHLTRIGLLHLLFIAVALMPIPCIHYSLNEAIRRSLQEECFDSGIIVKGGQEDDASFSTWNSESMAGFKLSVGSLSTLA